ncbi:hypothetical protein F5B20DRAFT_540013 [Whalleya microplaca]|nr:hypothetical protein F5B20DRAFT_540013 [Whalleya microplaca]
MVEAVRSWEILIEQGDLHAQRAEWEDALRAFNSALHLCESAEAFPDATYCRNMVLGRLGNTNRRFGRYAVARDLLERLLADLADFEVNAEHVEYSGELGVVYRHMNRLSDAKRTFETQYDMAKKLHLELPLCRAVGNLGVVNYQLSQQQKSPELLKLAIEQQLERVQRARQIQANADNEVANEGIAAHWKKIATTWEIIGLSRLSLCYAAHGDLHEAVKAASKGLEITKNSEDPTLLAMSRFFLGHALLAGGLHEEAMEQFNPPEECTPAIALCKEPSDEHRQYLQELVEAGVDMDVVDEHGYTALDYAVFNGDSATEAVVSEGLRRILRDDVEGQLQQRQTGARLRKAYRELFQEKLRPMLLGERGHESLRALRRVYANALDGDEEKRKRFDNLVLMRYSKFSRFGRLPRSSDNLVEELESGPDDRASDAFIIFISYRWINQFPSGKSPDDANHTQYHRMLDAVEEFLKIHRSVDREALYIWMDYACIDQGNPTAGVSALPMIIAQCDAVISLVDDLYYTRAWCAVEALLIQTLVNSYKMHLWYEQVLVPSGEGEDGGDRSSVWRLQAGPTNLPLVISEKHLSFEEEDRPKVLFLERQSKLFG